MNEYLKLEGLDKSFPGVHAVDDVSLEIRQGEVHVLLGENGAGKSTLMKLLSGAQRPDKGEIYLNDKRVKINNPREALKLGIGMVYQELSLIPSLSVAENIVLGQQPTRGPFNLIDWDELRKHARKALETLGVELNLSAQVRELEIGDQQLTEIAKIIAHEVNLLILDEPTSALTQREYERLFKTIKNLQNQGVTFVYITHKLEEVYELGTRVTVLRDGKKIDTVPVEEVNDKKLIQMMVGRELKEQYPKECAEKGKKLLQAKNLSCEKLKDVNFYLREGEVLGIAGLLGAGRSELTEILFGLKHPTGGELYVEDNKVEIDSPFKAIELGLGYLTKDRHEGLVERLSVTANVTLSSLNKICQSIFLNYQKEEELANEYVNFLDIDTPSLQQLVQYLSGGNQQKVVLAKWLASDSKIFILHEPTRGIDVATKVEVYNLMNRLTKEKKGLIMISSELPELLAMSDRLLVMRDGEIVGRFEHDETSREKVIELAAGRVDARVEK